MQMCTSVYVNKMTKICDKLYSISLISPPYFSLSLIGGGSSLVVTKFDAHRGTHTQ